MVRVVADSSTLISMSSNCLMSIFTRYSKKRDIEFFITPSVYEEAVARPLQIKRFELNALRIKDAVDSGVISVAVRDHIIASESERLMETANRIASVTNRNLRILHRGEAEVVALAKKISAQVIAVDERTTRTLIESPKSMPRFLRRRYGESVKISSKHAESFRKEISGIQIIRSVELIGLAHGADCFPPDLQNTQKALEAALYASKMGGCAVSFREIDSYLKKSR
jgi:hypothetical protein